MRFIALALLFPALAFANPDLIDAELNAVYKKAIKSALNPTELKEAQKAWLYFIKLDCVAYASQQDAMGEGYRLYVLGCQSDHKKQRIDYLKTNYLNNQ